MKKTFSLFLFSSISGFLLSFFACVSPVIAATLLFETPAPTIAPGNDFFVDVLIDPGTTPLNAIEGTLQFSADLLTLVRVEDGSSVVGPWIVPPTSDPGQIRFAGIIPNGFGGLIDPFTNKKGPGKLFRLIFRGREVGTATLVSVGGYTAPNDGRGTLESLPPLSLALTISPDASLLPYTQNDSILPTLTASVVEDPNLFEGRMTLIFTARDKESGVSYVEVQEGVGPFVLATSPYLLKDQTRNSLIVLRAHDNAGNIRTVILPPPYTAMSIQYILLALGILIALAISMYVRRNRRKKI